MNEEVESDEGSEEVAGEGVRVEFGRERARVEVSSEEGGGEVDGEREVDERRFKERVLVRDSGQLQEERREGGDRREVSFGFASLSLFFDFPSSRDIYRERTARTHEHEPTPASLVPRDGYDGRR